MRMPRICCRAEMLNSNSLRQGRGCFCAWNGNGSIRRSLLRLWIAEVAGKAGCGEELGLKRATILYHGHRLRV